MKDGSVGGLLRTALACLDSGAAQEAQDLALQALARDDSSVPAWRILALARETSGDLTRALEAYGSALALAPGDADLLTGLGRLALDMGMASTAEGLLRQIAPDGAGGAEPACLLARALEAQGRGEEAVAILSGRIQDHPEEAICWNALGLILSDRGDLETAGLFFAEALRLEPQLVPARFNSANLMMTLGDVPGALSAFAAMPEAGLSPRDRATLVFSRACAHLALGNLAEGWRDYTARNDPAFPGSADFDIPGRRWSPNTPLAGLRLRLVGEQGLGDEVMFAGMIPDLLEGEGRTSALSLVVEPRLVSLFRRSFPTASVEAHATVETGGRRVRSLAGPVDGTQAPDAWAPMADLLPVLRPEVAAFADRPAFLRADPRRVDAYRAWLSGLAPGLRVGLLWKSGLMSGSRAHAFAPFEAWSPVLRTPGVTFINLQYGDCGPEIELARRDLGVDIHSPPGLDLRLDLEGVAALSCALDLVVGVSNASFNLAAACGAPAWLVAAADAWTTLGADAYPWYPQVRLFQAAGPGDWTRVYGEVAGALASRVAQG